MAVVPTGHLSPQISRATRAVDLRGQPRGRPRDDRNLRRKGAQLVASGRVPVPALLASIDALGDES